MNLYLINPDRNLSHDINSEQDQYIFNPDRNLSNIINPEHDIFNCASDILENSNCLYCKIYIYSYSLEIVNTQKQVRHIIYVLNDLL